MNGISSASSSRARFWPLRPKPQMITWSWRAIVVAAICVICAARASQSLAVNRRTIGSAKWMSSGADSIDSTIAASTTCAIGARHERWSTRERQQHQRELARLREVEAGAQRRAERRAEDAGQRDDQRELRDDGHDEQQQHPERCCAATTARSSAMPTVTKKSPSSTSRNGLMSSSTW